MAASRTPPSTLLAAARPGLAELLDKIRATLSPEARAELDSHQTHAELRTADTLRETPAWQLQGSDLLWFSSPDVANLMEIRADSMSKRIAVAEASGDLTDGDVRRGVRDQDVRSAIRGETPGSEDDVRPCLTQSPRGTTMLSLDGVLVLLQTCSGQRGVQFRKRVVATLKESAQLERIAIGLQLVEHERLQRAATATSGDEIEELRLQLQLEHARCRGREIEVRLRQIELQRDAMAAWSAHLAQYKPVSRQLQRLAVGDVAPSPATPRADAGADLAALVPGATEFPPPFTFRGLRALSAALGCSWGQARQRLDVAGLWSDDHWHLVGQEPVVRSGRVQLQTVHAFRAGILTELLHREQQGWLFPQRETP